MVAHEYVGVNLDAMLVHRITQQFVVMPAIFFIHKDGAAVHSALGDVEGSAWEFQTGLARHDGSIARTYVSIRRCDNRCDVGLQRVLT
jgi:hypothetical protein